MNFKNRYGEYALITGASSGIGKEFAIQLAEKGMSLILVARRLDKLDELAQHLMHKNKVIVKTIALDLLEKESVEKLVTATNNFAVGLLIANAGKEVHGNYLENNIKDEMEVLTLNSFVPMQLVHHFGNKMKTKNKGGIILLASTFAHQAVPYFANYASSKAYILSLGQALNYELKKMGIDVMVLSPGPTKTDMLANMQDIDTSKMPLFIMSVQPVVKKTLNALGKKSIVIPGVWNNIMDSMGKYLTPRSVLTKMFGFLVLRATRK